jgi:hypothetical protein
LISQLLECSEQSERREVVIKGNKVKAASTECACTLCGSGSIDGDEKCVTESKVGAEGVQGA